MQDTDRFLPSSRRTPKSRAVSIERRWIPAFAGMTIEAATKVAGDKLVRDAFFGIASNARVGVTRIFALGALVLATMALSGCVETRFESPPGDNIETCDVRWKGLWVGEEAEAKDNTSAISIDDGCRVIVLDQPQKGGPFKEIHVPVNFVHADGKDYVVVTDVALSGLVKIPPLYGITPAPAKSFYIDRYEAHGDRIELFSVNDQIAAQRIIDGKFEGTISKTDNELHVFIRGDRAKVLEIVRHAAIFSNKSNLQMIRSKLSVAEFERTAIAAQKTKP